MIKPEQIPDEVIHSFIKANNGCECGDCMKVAISAAINAWPGLSIEEGGLYWRDEGPIVLPILEGK